MPKNKLRGENGSSRRSVYMPDGLYLELAGIADKNDLSTNAQIVAALRQWVDMYKAKK